MATAKKAVAKKAVAPKATAKKAAVKKEVTVPKVTKVQQALDILNANKNADRKDVVALIAKTMKCTPERAGCHYQAAKKRM